MYRSKAISGGYFAAWELKQVRGKARSLVGSYGFRYEDVPDIEQELLLKVFRSRKASAGWKKLDATEKTIMDRILRNRIRDLIDEAKGKIRRGRYTITDHLSTPVRGPKGSEDLTLEDQVGEDHAIRRRRGPTNTPADLAMDMSKCRGELTPLQETLCRLLEQGHNISESAKDLGVKRTTLHYEIARIRRIFQDNHLQDYL